jgi:TRAP-type C4-dicarboxylate transport system permease small subunit
MTRWNFTRACRLVFHRIPLSLAALLLAAAVAINFANALGRYVFQSAIYWAEEAMIYMAIWSVFLAAIAIAYDRAHLAMDFFSARLSDRWKRAANAATTVATAAVCLFMALQSLKLLGTLIRNGQNSIALEIPMSVPQSSLLFGFVMIALAVTARLLGRPESEREALAADEAGPAP